MKPIRLLGLFDDIVSGKVQFILSPFLGYPPFQFLPIVFFPLSISRMLVLNRMGIGVCLYVALQKLIPVQLMYSLYPFIFVVYMCKAALQLPSLLIGVLCSSRGDHSYASVIDCMKGDPFNLNAKINGLFSSFLLYIQAWNRFHLVVEVRVTICPLLILHERGFTICTSCSDCHSSLKTDL